MAVTAANNFIFDLPKKKEHFHFWGAWSHEKYDILKYILLKKKKTEKIKKKRVRKDEHRNQGSSSKEIDPLIF